MYPFWILTVLYWEAINLWSLWFCYLKTWNLLTVAHTKHSKIHVVINCKGENHSEKKNEQQNHRIIVYIMSYVNFFYPYRFLLSVAYRQFVRLVWEYVGKSNRLPLPCFVYNAIRSAFPFFHYLLYRYLHHGINGGNNM